MSAGYSNFKLHQMMEGIWASTFVSLMRPSYTKGLFDEGLQFSQKFAPFLNENYSKYREITLIDPFRMGVILDLMHEVKDLPGVIVECGSYKGGCGILMALLLRDLGVNKEIHLFDSFQGLPEPAVNDKGYKKGQFVSDFDKLQQLIEELELNNVKLHKGWFSDTVPSFVMENNKICLLHIDCDLYDSTKASLYPLYPLVVDGGGVVLDDFNDGGGGEKMAVLDFLKNQNIVLNIGPAPQVYFKKNSVRNTDNRSCIHDSTFDYDFGKLINNVVYTKWLEEELGSALPFSPVELEKLRDGN